MRSEQPGASFDRESSSFKADPLTPSDPSPSVGVHSRVTGENQNQNDDQISHSDLEDNRGAISECEEEWGRFESNVQEVFDEMVDDIDFEKVIHELSFYKCNESFYLFREEIQKKALIECASGKVNGYKSYGIALDLRPRHRIEQMDVYLKLIRSANASDNVRPETLEVVIAKSLIFIQNLMQHPLDFGEIMIVSAVFGEIADVLRPDLKIPKQLKRMVLEMRAISKQYDPINIITSDTGSMSLDEIPADLEDLPKQIKENLAEACDVELSARIHYQSQIGNMIDQFSKVLIKY